MTRDPFSDLDDAGRERTPANAGGGAPEGGPAADRAEAPAAEPGETISREEALRQRDDARRAHDEMVRAMLAGGGQQGHQQPEPRGRPEPEAVDFRSMMPEGVDDDSAALLAHFGEKLLPVAEERAFKRFESTYGGTLARVEHDGVVSDLEARIPGYAKELQAEVQKRWEAMPQAERERYNDPNGVGAEAIALRILADRRAEAAADTSGMAQTAPFGGSRQRPSAGKTGKDVWDLDDKDFEQVISRVKNGERFRG